MKPNLDAIRMKWRERNIVDSNDVPTLLAHVDMLEHMLAEERENVDTLRARIAELEGRGFLPPINAEHEAIIDALLAEAREGATKRPIERDAYRRGAEAMREACAQRVEGEGNGHYGLTGAGVAKTLRALPIPEEP